MSNSMMNRPDMEKELEVVDKILDILKETFLIDKSPDDDNDDDQVVYMDSSPFIRSTMLGLQERVSYLTHTIANMN